MQVLFWLIKTSYFEIYLLWYAYQEFRSENALNIKVVALLQSHLTDWMSEWNELDQEMLNIILFD